MSHKMKGSGFSLILCLLAGFVVLVGGLVGLILYYERLPENLSQHETLILGQTQLVPSSNAAMRVVVRDSRDGIPLPDATVKVSLKSDAGRAKTLFKGVTDRGGTLNVDFAVPDVVEPDQILIVETQSKLGRDRLEKPVTITRDYRVLLTTDKPLYQPGQVIHIRALALGAFDRYPAAGAPLEITIADAKGNTVLRETLTTSDFGVAATDFQLASEVNTGSYKIQATLGNTSSEKTVTVEHYVLPKFDVVLMADRAFYRPGERVEGMVRANYFFGKPVAGGEVVLEGYTFDVERAVAVSLQGTTDDEGNFAFAFTLPDYIAGSDLEGGIGRFYIQADLADLAGHTEVEQLSLPIAQRSLVIDAVPESGQFRPNVENILYVMTSTPDGQAAETTVTVTIYETGEILTAETGSYGLAELRFIPTTPYVSLRVEARDRTGATSRQEFTFDGVWSDETVLLRPDAPIYCVGDTMYLSLFTSTPQGTVYLDMVRAGQTVSTRAVDVRDGQAELAVDLTPDLYGTLELHAYKILSSGTIVRDTRWVVVDAAEDLDVSLVPGREEYRPGEDADLNVQVSDAKGGGVRAALGVAIVDESVFALAEQDPGFAKLTFMLEQELLQPKYELHGYSIPDLVIPMPIPFDDDPAALMARETAGKAALASASRAEFERGWPSPFTLTANSHEQTVERAEERRVVFFSRLSVGLFGLFLILSLVVLVVSCVAVIKAGGFWRSMGLAVGFAMLLVLGAGILLRVFDWVLWSVAEVIIPPLFAALGLLELLGFIMLVGVVIKHKDTLTATALTLAFVCVVLLPFLVFTVERGDVWPSETMVVLGFLALALLPLAFLLRAAGFALERRPLAGAAAFAVALMPLLAVILGSAATPIGVTSTNLTLDDGMLIQEAEAVPMARGLMGTGGEDASVEEKSVMVDLGTAMPDAAQGHRADPPRLRQYFPETMLWLPDETTDEGGALTLSFPVADSITSWRVSALASSQDGRLGSETVALRVFQDFFIDLDLPGALTVGDEIAIPVGVFNYMQSAQTVRLELEQFPWFELLDDPIKELEIPANDITVVTFRVRARDFGIHPFQVTAWGTQMSDAIRKEVRVFPNGKEIFQTRSDKLNASVRERVQFPTGAIPGTQKLIVKIYPGIVSQVVEGLDALLRMPYGCFEQTSSTTYPNVLVMDYLKMTGQASPEVQMKAEAYINLGYQRLATFEVGSSGGFSLFGEAPADPMLTAYGLQEFSDMRRVHHVDAALLTRTAEWLFAQQASDGSWEGTSGFHESRLTNQTGRLPVTAYIVWALADADYADDARTLRGVGFLKEFASRTETAYDLALVVNALVAVDTRTGEITPATEAVLDRLAGMVVLEDDAAYWEGGADTFMGASGAIGDLETTALAALAFLRAGRHPDLANAALTSLVRAKDSFGTWHTTSTTVMALKAFLESVRSGVEDTDAEVMVMLNGGQSRTVQITPETFDVINVLTFGDVQIGAENIVDIETSGAGNLMYQMVGSVYVPWDEISYEVKAKDLVTIDVSYDRTELAVNDTVTVDVVVKLKEAEGKADSAIVDLGLPPGFSVEVEGLTRLIARFDDVPPDYAYATLERFELTGRQIILYVSNLSGEEPLTFSYRLRAKFPLIAQTPSSTAYDYYNPDVAGENAPALLTVLSETQ